MLAKKKNWLSTKSGKKRKNVLYRKINPCLYSCRADEVQLIGFFPACAISIAPYVTWLYTQEVKPQFSDFNFF